MSLTKTERLILANQSRILALLDSDNSESHNHRAEILEHGYEGQYDEVFTNISEGISQEISDETENILQMFFVIDNIIEGLEPNERAQLELGRIPFDGFDGNHDPHYHYAQFIVNEGGLFEERVGFNWNSHTRASLMRYRRMLPVYNRVLQENNHILTLDGLRTIIAAA